MRQFRIMMMSLALIFCASCDLLFPGDNRAEILIDPQMTRATELDFEEGDMIGITIDCPGAVYKLNTPMTFSAGRFSADDLVWYDNPDESCNLYAYYPYQASGIPSNFKVRQDQGGDALTASDIMAAVRTDVKASKEPVSMLFYHLFSMLEFKVSNLSSSAVSGVSVSGVKAAANVDLNAKTVGEATGTAMELIAHQDIAGEAYSLILPPQTAAMTIKLKMASGKELTRKLDEKELTQGKKYRVNLNVGEDDIKVMISGEIDDWDDAGEIPVIEIPPVVSMRFASDSYVSGGEDIVPQLYVNCGSGEQLYDLSSNENQIVFFIEDETVASVSENGTVSKLTTGQTILTALAPSGAVAKANVTFLSIDGEWMLQTWDGEDFSGRIYMAIGGSQFTLYQCLDRFVENFARFAGTWTAGSCAEGTTFTGTYSDGSSFAEPYLMNISSADGQRELVLKGLESGVVSIYVDCTIPSSVKYNAAVVHTKGGEMRGIL